MALHVVPQLRIRKRFVVRSDGACETAEDGSLELVILPAEWRAANGTTVLRLENASGGSQTRGIERAIAECKADEDGDGTENQPPRGREEKDGPD